VQNEILEEICTDEKFGKLTGKTRPGPVRIAMIIFDKIVD